MNTLPLNEQVADLERFFAAFREHGSIAVSRLAQFFTDFDHEYARARDTRAATTPHLDVLRVFGLEFAELRHSAALAWFLDPGAEHEQGDLFARTLLQLLGCTTSPAGRYTVQRERHGRTDVACYAPGQFAVFVENKVRHSEREAQVNDMVRSLVRLSDSLAVPRAGRFAVFLTDTGAVPVTGPTADSPGFLLAHLKSVSRVQLIESFRAALAAQPVVSPLLLNFLDSYLAATRRLRAQLC
jgi:hypothetical protein